MAKPAAYEIAPNVWRIPAAPFDFVNIYALVDDDGQVSLVDTGTKGATKRTLAGLAAMGKAAEDVTRIVLTHAHGDHAGGAAKMAMVTGASVAIHESDAQWALAGQAPPRDSATAGGRFMNRLGKGGNGFPAIVVGEEFSDDHVLPIAGGLRVVHTPGHTMGHVALLHETTGVLITGDSIWNVRKMSWGIKAFCQDIALNQQTAHVLGELSYQVAAFTHGPHVSDRARERVRGYLTDAANRHHS
ncbi:MBL fold metallo-hydrolase [Actinoallomurus iriomotensis]|uniref:MBL fold metallo-hydrolase n=1 Tax=Actinoallomurus iriomotensis TaxID=478107 RepID=A0A9W6S4C8_9ACTN|nr:MBL fold metallo-hydrolase [Actinoallomurus iriomotensis]GLY88376.1 MBL fold metallo-hydrolase [Actinoallomurus iriomotensis]